MAKDSARRQDDESLDYEVVGEDKPRRSKRDDDDEDRPRNRKRDDDDEDRPRNRKRDDDDEDRPRNRKRDDDEDDRPRRSRRDDDDDDNQPRNRKRDDDDDDDDRPRRSRRDDDYDDDDRPRKKKIRKKKQRGLYNELEDKSPHKFDVGDWIMSGLLFSTGLILSLVSAVGIMGSDHAFKALGVMFLSLLLLIPLMVGTLMIVGMMVSIDYGEYKMAIIKLAGVATFNNGLLWLAHWIGIPWFIAIGLCGLICFGLFMGLFELDTWETNISLAAVQTMQFLAKLLIIYLAFAQARHEARKDRSGDDDVPIKKDLGRHADDGDDIDDEMPPPKGKFNQPPFGRDGGFRAK
jgi:hypothetical protein